MNEPSSPLPSKDSIGPARKDVGQSEDDGESSQEASAKVGFREDGEDAVDLSEDTSGKIAAQGGKPSNADRTSQRRLVERLSGWRLIAFFVSAALNIGLLVALIVLPLFLDSTRLLVVTALVSASHCVFLVTVAGFRFAISTKISLGLVHATACMWALASVDALPWVALGRLEVATLYMILMLTLMITVGGIAVAVLTGFHRSRRFSVRDVLVLVSAFAILFPLVLEFVPRNYFTDGISSASLRSAFAVAATSGVSCLVISNLCSKFIQIGELGLSPLMIVIGWFLLAAMVDWNLCQFGFLVAVWIMVSLIPVYGSARVQADNRRDET